MVCPLAPVRCKNKPTIEREKVWGLVKTSQRAGAKPPPAVMTAPLFCALQRGLPHTDERMLAHQQCSVLNENGYFLHYSAGRGPVARSHLLFHLENRCP